MHESYVTPAIAAPLEERSGFLRRVAGWTFAGLTLTAIVSIFSALFIAPLVLRVHWLVSLGVIYGSFILAQTVARGMVYGKAKGAGFALGTSAIGIALGFLLFIVVATTGTAQEGFSIIGTALLLVVLSSLAMLMYVTIEKREFSMLRAGLAMLTLPMLGLMALQLIFPMHGTLGLVISGIFVLVSVGSLAYTLNVVVHSMSTEMAMQGGYELTLGIVVLFWNILTFLMRMRRR